MSERTGSDVNSQEQAVKQKQSENLGWSSSFLKNPSTSYDSRSKNVHFQVLLQENSEEFILMDDWLCIDSSSSEDDEPSNQGEIMPASEKGTTRISVPYSGQVQTSPVLNFALNKTTYVEEENIVADNIPSVDVKRETDKASTYSAVSEKGMAESYFILDASEGLRGNSDECISSDEIEVVDMIESMPNCSLSCSDPITHKVSGRETTFFEPYNVVISDMSGSSAPKNLSKTESFSILPRQTSPSKPTCVTLPELKFDRSVVTSVHETPLRTECASVKKNSVGLELSDKSKTKISRAAIKDEAFCNMVSNYGDHFETEDVIIISDDEDDIVGEPQNLKETSEKPFLCMKNLSVKASQFSRELPVSKLSKGRSSTRTTDKVSATNKMFSNTATNELSSKATINNVSPVHASATVIPPWVPANVRSPVNAQVYPSFSSPVKAQVHISSSSPVKAQVHASSLSPVKAQVHSSSSLVKALVHSSSSPVKAQDHSSFSLTATKIPVQLQSTSDHSEVIPTTTSRVQENLKTDAVDIWNIPKGDYKGREVDFVNNDDGFSPLSSTGGKTVNSAKCAILSSTGDRTTNLNKNDISSQQQTMEMEPSKNISSELVTSRMMETTLESHLYKTKKKRSHKGTELNISSSLDPTLKIHQAAAVYENFHSCQGFRKGYLKASECTPQLKKMKMTPESNVTRSSIVTSLPSPDSTVPDSTLCRYTNCPSSPEPLISLQSSITEATRVIGHNKTIDAHKHNGNSFVIEGLEVISKVINTLGPIGSAVEHLLVQSTLVVAEGKDPLELFLVKDNIMVLDLISQKLSSQIEGKLLPPDLIDSSEEALKMTDQLLEAASQFKSKETFLGLDIDAIARATNGNNAHQIIAFVKKMLKYQGKKEAKEEDLRNIFMAVTSMQCKLTVESMINNPLNFASSWKHDLAAKSSKIPDDSSHLLKMGLSEPLETLNSSLSPEEKTHQNSPNVHGKCTAKEKKASSALLATLLTLLPPTSSTKAIQPAEFLQSQPQYHLVPSKPRNYPAYTLPTRTQDGRQSMRDSSLMFSPSDGDKKSVSCRASGSAEQKRTSLVCSSNDLQTCTKDMQISSKIKVDLLPSERKSTFNSEKSFYKMSSVFDKRMLYDGKYLNKNFFSSSNTFTRHKKHDHWRTHRRLSSHNQNVVENQRHQTDARTSFSIPEKANDKSRFATRLQASESASMGCEPHGIYHRQGRIVTEKPLEERMLKNETKRSNPVDSKNSEFIQRYKYNFTPLSHKDIGLCEKKDSSGLENFDLHQNYEQPYVLGHNYKAAHVDGHHTRNKNTPMECTYSRQNYIKPQGLQHINEISKVEESNHSSQLSGSEGTSDSHKMSAVEDLDLYDIVNLVIHFHALPTAKQQALMKYLENLKATSPAVHHTLLKMLDKRGSL